MYSSLYLCLLQVTLYDVGDEQPRVNKKKLRRRQKRASRKSAADMNNNYRQRTDHNESSASATDNCQAKVTGSLLAYHLLMSFAVFDILLYIAVELERL